MRVLTQLNELHFICVRVCVIYMFQGQEYAEAYMLEYQRLETGSWIKFQDRKTTQVNSQWNNLLIEQYYFVFSGITSEELAIWKRLRCTTRD